MPSKTILQCICLILVIGIISADVQHASKSPVKRLVMMMMENRSFDHRLGWLKQLGFDIDGLNGNETNPVDPANPSKGTCHVRDTANPYDTINGSHSYRGTLKEQYGSNNVSAGLPPMNGFAFANHGNCSALEAIPVDDIPVTRAFVENFVVFDRWFSSFPGPTEVTIHS